MMMENTEFIIKSVVTKMSDMLESKQLQALDLTMRESMKGYTLQKEETALSTWLDDNEQVLKSFLATKKLEGCKDGTLKQYQLTVRQFYDVIRKNYREITRNDVKVFLAYRMRTVNENTLSSNARNLSSYFTWLHEEGMITSNPAKIKGIRAQEIENIHLTVDEEIMVRDVPKSLRDAAIIDFCLSTGVRVGELVSLDISDVNFQNNTVTFRGEKGNRRFRTVIMDARARKRLMAYLESRNDNHPALFVSYRKYDGQPRRLAKGGVEEITKSIGARAGLNKVLTVHVFRRTLATRLADKGCSMETIQEILGHKSPVTTQRYIAKSKTRAVREVSRFLEVA